MIWSLVYDLPGPAYFYLQVTANLFMAPTLIAVVGGLYWRRASATGATCRFVLGALTSLTYLVPSLKVDVATAGNLSWALAVAGFVVGSLLVPPARPAAPRDAGGRDRRPLMSWALFWLIAFVVGLRRVQPDLARHRGPGRRRDPGALRGSRGGEAPQGVATGLTEDPWPTC